MLEYKEHKLHSAFSLNNQMNTYNALALTFGNNISNFIIECTKICFYQTCQLCMFVGVCAMWKHRIYPSQSCSDWIKHGNAIVIYVERRGCRIMVIPVFIVLLCENWENSKWEIGAGRVARVELFCIRGGFSNPSIDGYNWFGAIHPTVEIVDL